MESNEFRSKTDDKLILDGQRGLSGTGDTIEMMRRLRGATEYQTEVMKSLNRAASKLTWVGIALAVVGAGVALIGLIRS